MNQLIPVIKDKINKISAAEDSSPNFYLYKDSLASGWQEWSDADVDTRESKPVYEGSRSISLRSQNSNSSLFFHPRKPFDLSKYTSVQLAMRSTGLGQLYGIQLLDSNEHPLTDLKPLTDFGPQLTINQWTVYNVPLATLTNGKTEISGFVIKGISGYIRSNVYIDSIILAGNGTMPPTNSTPTPTISNQKPTVTSVPVNSPTSVPTITSKPTPTKSANSSWWKPTSTSPIHWHWQLSDDFQYPRDVVAGAKVYDIDGEHATKDLVTKLHALGPNIIVICYFDAGVYEDYRSDAAQFPKSIIGKKDEGWDGSYWLDIRQHNLILPIMQARIQNWCKDKGFDAIEPDETENQDENEGKNITGFNLKRADNIAYNKEIARIAHELGLSVGLKGNTTETSDLVSYYDWTLNEECNQFNECDELMPFINANKAVFNIEYSANPNCTQMNNWHMNSAKRDLDLVGPKSSGYKYAPCIPNTQDNW